jgi:hypothetical protein
MRHLAVSGYIFTHLCVLLSEHVLMSVRFRTGQGSLCNWRMVLAVDLCNTGQIHVLLMQHLTLI